MVTSWARLVKVRAESSRMFSSAVYVVQDIYNLEELFAAAFPGFLNGNF